MNQNLLKQILSCFDKESFTEFIWKMWSLENIQQPNKYVGLKKVYRHPTIAFEQTRSNAETTERQNSYNLILPFYEPLELLIGPERPFFTPQSNYNKILKKYAKRTDKRIENWNIFSHGELAMPIIAFVTNIAGYEEAFYQDHVLPKLDQLVNEVGIIGQTKIGTCDSFVELGYSQALKAFQAFFHKNKSMVISLQDNEPLIQEFIPEKYYMGGVLDSLVTPVSPAYVNISNANQILQEFQRLLLTAKKESDLETFLKQHYQQIFGSKYDRIETQIWLRFPELDIGAKARRLDLFLRNSIQNDWELVELKHILKPIRLERNVPAFASHVHFAIEQLKNYGNLLRQDSVKRHLASLGLEYFVPELKLVISKTPDLEPKQWRYLKANHEQGIKIITMDELLSEAKARYINQLNTL